MSNATTAAVFAQFPAIATAKLSYYPSYHFAREELVPGFSDKYLSIFAPFAVYWIFSAVFQMIDTSGWFEAYRIHEPEEEKRKNRVTVRQVIWAVLLQQVIQTALAFVWLEDDDAAIGPFRDHAGDIATYAVYASKAASMLLGTTWGPMVMKKHGAQAATWMYWWGVPTLQLFFASFVIDTWQYFLHRAFHTNKFLYRHVHSWHHRLYVPYAFGALYNHPIEGFLFDTLGATIAHSCALMTTRQGVLFFALSTAKTVDDHCGFAFPWDPFQHLFGNNSDYHDIHHQIGGLKYNFSQPYFIHFDHFLGTRMTRKQYDDRRKKSDAPTADSSEEQATVTSSSS